MLGSTEFKKLSIPNCANPGCTRPTAVRHWNKKSGEPSLKPLCTSCTEAARGNRKLDPGITAIKTHRCSNENGLLGWPCPVNFDLIPPGTRGMTDLDHKDGNPYNNVKENIQELCVPCHKIKSQRAGDYNSWR